MLPVHLAPWAKLLKDGWPPHAGPEPDLESVEKAKSLGATPGDVYALAWVMYCRPSGASRQEVIAACGGPQHSRAQEWQRAGKIDYTKARRQDGTTAYFIGTPGSRPGGPNAKQVGELDPLGGAGNEITRNDILDAIAALDKNEPHEFGPSVFYDLIESGKRYPPKAVVGLAARRSLGRALRPQEFSGGQNSWAFRLLRERGFTIVEKDESTLAGQLPAISPPRVWIEDTKTAEHGHGGPGWEFGKCLWSPSSYASGSDHYAIMREPNIDDLVIHINEGRLVGYSYVSAPYQEHTDPPPMPGPWGGRKSYYRIDLKDFQEFPQQIPLAAFIDRYRLAIETELRDDSPKRYPFILYGEQKELRHAQGAYLTRCTPKLYELIRSAVLGTDAKSATQATSPRYWAMALGEGARLWDECQEKGIAAIGWDEFDLGDLTEYPDRNSNTKRSN
jgi:hypothetical protein